MNSQTKENYLKAMFYLAEENGEISLSALSQALNVSTPTANSMVKKLQKQNWVIYEKYKPLVLTDDGRKIAALIIRKHRLTEMFLVERMGFGWEEVHDIAEQMEHLDSELLFDRMNEMLGYPKVDPHGSPIPDKEGNIPEVSYVKLSSVDAGKRVRLIALGHSSKAFLVFLNTKKLKLGIEIQVEAIESFDKSMTVSFAETKSIMFSREVCEKLLVEYV